MKFPVVELNCDGKQFSPKTAAMKILTQPCLCGHRESGDRGHARGSVSAGSSSFISQ